MVNLTNSILICDYDPRLFPFYEIFSGFCQDVFGNAEVERLHRLIPNPSGLLRVGEDQSTYGHKALYKIDPLFRPTGLDLEYEVRDRGFVTTYQKFIRLLESDVFAEPLIYQTLPTLRIQLPHNLSVGEYHRDRNYNHPLEEVNIWVPVTKATGTATIQIETAYCLGDHQPVEVEQGQYVIFDSALEHGNEVNREGYTRVSFDFRVIPRSRYKESGKASVNEHKDFRIGSYYSVLS